MKIRKLFLTIFTVGVFGIFGCGDDDNLTLDCLPVNLQNGVIAFYPFNDGSLDDESSNSNDLSNSTTAAPSSDRNGNTFCAYEFQNNQTSVEFITTTNTSFLNNLDAFSVSIWYEPLDTNRNVGFFEVLLGRGSDGHCPDRRGEWSVGLFDCRKAVFGHNNSVWARGSNLTNSCQEEVVALTDQWHHVVATKDGDEYKIYFNGMLNDQDIGNANCTNLHLAEDIGDLFIGSRYTGKVDDILIYDRALSAAEVTALFELEACCQ